MNRSEHLLSCLAEECAEVAQRVSKALRFGLQEIQPGQSLTNAERIEQELSDLIAVAAMLNEEDILDMDGLDSEAVDRKQAKVEKFMVYAVEQGALTEPAPIPATAA
jgi:NTP pyrophosphatase (non-canonical NTP hydrolase)